MKRIRRFGVLVVLLFLAMSVFMVSPGLGQQPERVKVLIAFSRQPGPAEEALVRGVGGSIKYTYHLVPAIAATVPERAINGLRSNPNVANVDLDLEVHAVDAELDNAWGVKRIGAGTVHGYNNKGTGVKVAIIDSGIDDTHPDLDANCTGGYDFVNSDDDPMDDYGHGTHVAGTVAAEDNDVAVSVVGVAPEAHLYALKVLNASGSGYWSDIIASVQWCVDNEMQVANLSLGSDRDPGGTVKATFDTAEAAGVVIVAAAGNSGNPGGKGNNVIYPARYDSVIAVAATNSSDNRASWSSTGDQVELAAPGVAVFSTWNDSDSPYDPQPVCDESEGCYKYGSGTSMASPHVAGTAALVIASGIGDANGNDRINDEVRLRLQQTADDLGAAGRDPQYGFGLVDADEAAPPPAGNRAPVADAGQDQSVTTGSTVYLDGTGSSDADGDSITYSWVFASKPANSNASLSNATMATPTFVADVDGTYEVELTVSDGELSGTDRVVVTVSEVDATTMHVQSIDMWYARAGQNYKIYTKVTIVDVDKAAVEGATVYLERTLPSGAKASGSGDTGADGTVTFVYGPTKTTGKYISTVTNVVKAEWSYDESANIKTSETLTVP